MFIEEEDTNIKNFLDHPRKTTADTQEEGDKEHMDSQEELEEFKSSRSHKNSFNSGISTTCRLSDPILLEAFIQDIKEEGLKLLES